jgi:hypothetical protein
LCEDGEREKEGGVVTRTATYGTVKRAGGGRGEGEISWTRGARLGNERITNSEIKTKGRGIHKEVERTEERERREDTHTRVVGKERGKSTKWCGGWTTAIRYKQDSYHTARIIRIIQPLLTRH